MLVTPLLGCRPLAFIFRVCVLFIYHGALFFVSMRFGWLCLGIWFYLYKIFDQFALLSHCDCIIYNVSSRFTIPYSVWYHYIFTVPFHHINIQITPSEKFKFPAASILGVMLATILVVHRLVDSLFESTVSVVHDFKLRKTAVVRHLRNQELLRIALSLEWLFLPYLQSLDSLHLYYHHLPTRYRYTCLVPDLQ